MMNVSRREIGFTLIELLVVIAIIAIMMATTMSALSLANDRGNLATCESHLQQIGLAWRMYVQDYGVAPKSLGALSRDRYVDDEAILRCSKTGAPYAFRAVAADAPPSTILSGCVFLEQVPPGKRPHCFGQGAVLLNVGGTVYKKCH